MYKTLCVAGLLLGMFGLVVGRSAGTQNASSTSPLIVARGKVVNQTTTIPTTTIYTPAQTGLYRLSVYGVVTTADPNSGSYYNYNLSWTDTSNTSQTYGGLIYSIDGRAGVWLNGLPAYSVAFQAVAGTPVTYSTQLQGPPDAAVYSLYWVIERLE